MLKQFAGKVLSDHWVFPARFLTSQLTSQFVFHFYLLTWVMDKGFPQFNLNFVDHLLTCTNLPWVCGTCVCSPKLNWKIN